MKLNENTKITLTVHQLKKLIRESWSTEDYYDAEINREQDEETAWEYWAENRFDDEAKDALNVFWNEIAGDCDKLKDKITTAFLNSHGLDYLLDWDSAGDPYYVYYTVTTPDGKKYYIDNQLGVHSVEDDTDRSEELVQYFKNGRKDIEQIINDVGEFEQNMNYAYEEVPKKRDEYDGDEPIEDWRDYVNI